MSDNLFKLPNYEFFSIPVKRSHTGNIQETYDFHGYKLAEVCSKFQRPMALYLHVESKGKLERKVIIEEVAQDDTSNVYVAQSLELLRAHLPAHKFNYLFIESSVSKSAVIRWLRGGTEKELEIPEIKNITISGRNRGTAIVGFKLGEVRIHDKPYKIEAYAQYDNIGSPRGRCIVINDTRPDGIGLCWTNDTEYLIEKLGQKLCYQLTRSLDYKNLLFWLDGSIAHPTRKVLKGLFNPDAPYTVTVGSMSPVSNEVVSNSGKVDTGCAGENIAEQFAKNKERFPLICAEAYGSSIRFHGIFVRGLISNGWPIRMYARWFDQDGAPARAFIVEDNRRERAFSVFSVTSWQELSDCVGFQMAKRLAPLEFKKGLDYWLLNRNEDLPKGFSQALADPSMGPLMLYEGEAVLSPIKAETDSLVPHTGKDIPFHCKHHHICVGDACLRFYGHFIGLTVVDGEPIKLYARWYNEDKKPVRGLVVADSRKTTRYPIGCWVNIENMSKMVGHSVINQILPDKYLPGLENWLSGAVMGFPIGIGKTSLKEEASDVDYEHGYAVLAGIPSHMEIVLRNDAGENLRFKGIQISHVNLGKNGNMSLFKTVGGQYVFHKRCVDNAGWHEYATAFETLEDMKKGIGYSVQVKGLLRCAGIELIRDVK